MGSTQGSSLSRARGNKEDKVRRIWTPKEEEKLILALKEIVAEGWKADNGFRGGFLRKLEFSFRKHLPGTDIRAQPHIVSKLTTWKKSYYSLLAVLSKSGVGFNVDGTHTVDCDPSYEAEVVKNDPNASKIIGKSWPMYEDWCAIFGKDRANGDGGEEVLESIKDMEGGFDINNEDINNGDYHVNLDDVIPPDHGESSYCQSQQPAEAPKYKSKKRKASDGLEAVCEVLREISSNTNSRLEKLASRIGYDYDLDKVRSEVFEKLNDFPGLSSVEKFKVCEILGKEIEKLTIFMGLPESSRLEYVYYVLSSS